MDGSRGLLMPKGCWWYGRTPGTILALLFFVGNESITESIMKTVIHGKWIYVCALLLVMNTAGAAAQQGKLRVGFLCEAGPDEPFWEQVVRVMHAAANDLNVELIVKYDPTRSTYTTKKIGEQFIDSEPKLDYLLTKYLRSVTATHIEHARRRGIKVFVFNSDIPEPEYDVVGRLPREKYANWIGHMVPDDKMAGYDLAGALIEGARRAKGDGQIDKIRILGLEAPHESTVGSSRRAGLVEKVAEAPDVVLQGGILTDWESSAAMPRIVEALEAHADTDILWSPNVGITWGAVLAVEQLGKVPGKDIQVGGFDWDSDTTKGIADGRITASMFGHFLQGAWALILVHDYHYSYDFADSPGVRMFTPLSIMNAENYNGYKAGVLERDWEEIDFRKFSKKYNPQLKTYNFSISQFLK